MTGMSAAGYLAPAVAECIFHFDSPLIEQPSLASSYPSFVFGLLSPIENPSLPGQGLARAAIDPAGAHGEGRGAAPGRGAASPLRTSGRLKPWPSLL
jgi:hypothetical protein